ncbi:MAG: sulfite exporter TauE/SafE family protein [Proteobacteria bacterium]|nr:sulfite exporter TauE/SafE family protein [Pseudomonadota bacterium]
MGIIADSIDTVIPFLLEGTGLDSWGFATLCGVSFFGSFITASMGIGGGGLVLATMALFLPPPVLIPLHGVVQLGSNIGRTALMARDVFIEVVPMFLIGTLLGALLGGQLVVSLPITLLQTVLAFFILYSAWAPHFKAKRPTNRTFFFVGAIGTFLTMFIGATGPLVAPFVAAACDKRQQVVATHAMLMSIQHGLKIIAFGYLGFSFGPYVPLLIGLFVFGFVGTFVGKLVLNRLPEKMFRTGLKVILTMLALRLLYGAANSFQA